MATSTGPIPLAVQPSGLHRSRHHPSLPDRKRAHSDTTAGAQDPLDDERQQLLRTGSWRLKETIRFRVAYTDDALRSKSLSNMDRLIRAAQQPDAMPTSTGGGRNTSVLLAKKALRYRKMLARAQAVDMDDPAFDITEFLRIKWQKVAK